jgi:hypothetical protein
MRKTLMKCIPRSDDIDVVTRCAEWNWKGLSSALFAGQPSEWTSSIRRRFNMGLLFGH